MTVTIAFYRRGTTDYAGPFGAVVVDGRGRDVASALDGETFATHDAVRDAAKLANGSRDVQFPEHKRMMQGVK